MLTSRYFLRPQSLEGQIWFQEDRKTCDIEVSQELKMSNGTKTCHKWSILLLFSFLFAHFELTKCSEQKLLVLSMDGFRYDYYDFYAHLMPNLKFLGTNGVLAKNGVKSTFQTVTFPTHFTIATGLNEETHGLVANSFYDRKRNESFTRNGHKKYFYQGEPIWVTAKKSGKKTAVLLWVGNSADWSPYHPDVNVPFDPRISFETRIVTALEHLNNDIDFAMVYVDEPDSIQHDYGTFSSNLSDTMVSLDKLLGKIVSNATQGRLKDKLNVIVLADHGMLNVTARKQIDLNIVSNRTLEAVARFGDALTKEQVMKMLRSFRYEKGDTVTHFYATSNLSSAISQANLFRKAMTDSNITRIIEEMKKLKLKNPSFESPMKLENLTYYLRHQLPDRWFYKNNDRIGDLVVVTDAGTIHNVIGVSSKLFTIYLPLFSATDCILFFFTDQFNSYASSEPGESWI